MNLFSEFKNIFNSGDRKTKPESRKKGLSRRDFLKIAGIIGLKVGSEVSGVSALYQKRGETLAAHQLQETELQESTVMLGEYGIDIEINGEKFVEIDFSRLATERPDVCQLIESDEYSGYIFRNDRDHEVIIDLSGLQEKKILYGNTQVHHAALNNVEPNLFQTGEGYGEVRAGFVFIGNFSLRSQSQDAEKYPTFTLRPEYSETDPHIGIYAKSLDHSNRIDTFSLEGVSVAPTQPYNVDENTDWWCPAPAGITGEDIHLSLSSLKVVGDFGRDPYVRERLDRIVESGEYTFMNDDFRELYEYSDPHVRHTQCARGIVVNNTHEDPLQVTIENAQLQDIPWDGISIQGNCDVLLDDVTSHQERFVLDHLPYGGASVGNVHTDRGSLRILNSDLCSTKGVWITGSYTDRLALSVEDTTIQSIVWGIDVRVPTELKNVHFKPTSSTGEVANYQREDNTMMTDQIGILSVVNTSITHMDIEVTSPEILDGLENNLLLISSIPMDEQITSGGKIVELFSEKLNFQHLRILADDGTERASIGRASLFTTVFELPYTETTDRFFIVYSGFRNQVGIIPATTSDMTNGIRFPVYWVEDRVDD